VPFPDFDPIVHIWHWRLAFGPFAIRWYALAYVAGILLGWRYVVGMLKNPRLWTHRPPPLTPAQMDDFILWLTLGVIVGGRIGHTLFYDPGLFLHNQLEILKVWHGGMSFHGGAIGVGIAIVIFAWKNRIDLYRLADVVAAAYPIGHFLGRIANFINGELWGRPTDLPWGIVFCNQSILAQNNGVCPAGMVPRHPSQLYEAVFEGLVVFLILRWATHSKHWTNRRGVITGLFLIAYGVFRIAIENVRQPDFGMPDFPLGLTMGMILSIPMLFAGGWLMWRGLKEPLPPPIEARPEQPATGAHEPA
jgi:phosphatidylglycerol:prolipoprotein diacylglycerol transferase